MSLVEVTVRVEGYFGRERKEGEDLTRTRDSNMTVTEWGDVNKY